MQGEPSAWVDGGHWSTTEQVVAKRGDLLPLSTRGTVCESFKFARNTIGPTIPKQGNFCAPNCSSQCRASYNVDRRYYL